MLREGMREQAWQMLKIDQFFVKGNWVFLVLFLKLFSTLKLFQNKKKIVKPSYNVIPKQSDECRTKSKEFLEPSEIRLWQWGLWDVHGSRLMPLPSLCPSHCHPCQGQKSAHWGCGVNREEEPGFPMVSRSHFTSVGLLSCTLLSLGSKLTPVLASVSHGVLLFAAKHSLNWKDFGYKRHRMYLFCALAVHLGSIWSFIPYVVILLPCY